MAAKSKPTDALAAARAAIDRGDLAGACRELTRAWTAVPSPRIAALAARASKRLPVRALPKSLAAREAAWLALARTRDADALPTLLGVEWPVHPRGATARLAELVTWPPDPRIAEALLALWHAERYRSNAGAVFWKSAFRTLSSWGDPRPGELESACKSGFPRHAVFDALHGLSGAVAIPKAIARELDALEAALDRAEPAPMSRAALFAAVYAEPGSDAPRAVLGDALLADGDPRGELIQLQLAPQRKTAARVRALLRDHGVAWASPFGPANAPELRRGFVAAVRLDTLPTTKQLDDPAWRTIEEVAVAYPRAADLARALAHPNLAGVRVLRGPMLKGLGEITTARQLDRLQVWSPLSPLPPRWRVRELAVYRGPNATDELTAMLAWLEAQPQLPELRAFELEVGHRDLAAAATWLVDRAPATLERIAFTAAMGIERMTWHVELTRAGGRAVAITATWHGRLFGGRAEGLGADLAAIPKGSLASFAVRSAVTIEAGVRVRLDRDLATGLARHKLPVPSLAAKAR